MRWFYKLPLRFRSLFRKSRVEHELSDELRLHLEKLIEENVGKAMSPEEARYTALRELRRRRASQRNLPRPERSAHD